MCVVKKAHTLHGQGPRIPSGGSRDSNSGNTDDSKAKTALDMFIPENFSRTFQSIKNKGQESGKGIGSITLLFLKLYIYFYDFTCVSVLSACTLMNHIHTWGARRWGASV